ncbi:MAG: sigma 54-interacting transcriptional regulator [Myxococcales bacterium]|nr:sigma 54-interacting transcriptional regulator [Myxococcales bacterium]MCB9707055.1 sigma 54-interacting transcriptional regulator [Myxococcales bacterium]
MSQTETITGDFAPRGEAAAGSARLSVVHPPSLATVIELGQRPLILGRKASEPNGQAIAHQTMSRRHLEIRWDAGVRRHFVIDLGSHNGSTLNGRAVGETPRPLDDNAVLRLGDVFLVYERADQRVNDDPTVDRAAIPGEALSICSLRERVGRIARDLSPALIIGESGAGKERIAAEIHRLSARRGPLVTVNCAALSPTLIESQLFGHVRGAFTGASQAQAGFFRAADRGTLFLDEIGELPLDLQPKLLRALESGEVTAVGASERRIVDVRVIAATNRELALEVEEGRFRRDLHARLALWIVDVPSLARRRADLIAWIDRLAARWAEERGLPRPPAIEFAPPAVEVLMLARWPDNLRGLNRLVHELAHLAGSGPLRDDALPAWLLAGGDRREVVAPAGVLPRRGSSARSVEPSPGRLTTPVPPAGRRPTRDELLATLERVAWSVRAAAREYERDRKQIKRWIAMYEIVVPGHSEGDGGDLDET